MLGAIALSCNAMPDNELKTFRTDTAVLLENKTCPFCREYFDGVRVVRADEHVIGRRFVPKGKMDRQWNQPHGC